MGLALLILILKTMALRTGNPHYASAARFWAKIFAINFAMGVVTGIPMEFQFGTNWSRFAKSAGGVIGQTLAMEGVFSFFLGVEFSGRVPVRRKTAGAEGALVHRPAGVPRIVDVGIPDRRHRRLDAAPDRIPRGRPWRDASYQLLGPAAESVARLAVHPHHGWFGGDRRRRDGCDRRVLFAHGQPPGARPHLRARRCDRGHRRHGAHGLPLRRRAGPQYRVEPAGDAGCDGGPLHHRAGRAARHPRPAGHGAPAARQSSRWSRARSVS